MVEYDLVARGIHDSAVVAAMREIPRELFVPEGVRGLAYEDGPLPIGCDQTISQPYIVAYMIQEAELTAQDSVLDVGTGSGYAAAVLSRIVRQVYSIERIQELSERGKTTCEALGYRNIEFRVGDGSVGWIERAPFDAIIATAAAPQPPRHMIDQLTEGGRLIVPVGGAVSQQLLRVRKLDGRSVEEWLEYVRFVPLVGEDGWYEARD